MRIKEYNSKLKKLDFPKAVQDSITEQKEAIANLQAIQLSKGQTSKGGDLPDYSEVSVEVYGKSEGPWRLKDTGAFWAGLTVAEVNAQGWRITSTDSKTDMILGKLSKAFFGTKNDKERAAAYVFGLNKETRAGGSESEPLATGIILPELKKQMEKQTGLKF